MVGGALSDRKGVNVPGVVLPLSAMTDKDRADLDFGLTLGVDWVALSFVQRPDDIDEVRGLVGRRAGVMAKLEKPAAIDCLDEILAQTDGIMVARGDLGVEMPPEEVPPIQKRIVRACRKAGKPVIVATQMLESMVTAPTPTRAEASDVATAVYDGADAVMLSAESASGKYPVEAVRIMDRIIARGGARPATTARDRLRAAGPRARPRRRDRLRAARAAGLLDRGRRHLHELRLHQPARRARAAGGADPLHDAEPGTARRLALAWGVHSMQIGERTISTTCVQPAARRPRRLRSAGRVVAITAGMPFGVAGNTNLLKLAVI